MLDLDDCDAWEKGLLVTLDTGVEAVVSALEEDRVRSSGDSGGVRGGWAVRDSGVTLNVGCAVAGRWARPGVGR